MTNNIINKLYNKHYYRLYDNNNLNDRLIINGNIEKIINIPKNINNIFNINISCGNIIHIPLVNNIYIEYQNNKKLININNLDINNYNIDLDDNFKIYSVKTTKNMYYQDIIIQTNNSFIVIQIYKFKHVIKNITHGAFIIYQNDSDNMKSNNTIYYTRDYLQEIDNIEDSCILFPNILCDTK